MAGVNGPFSVHLAAWVENSLKAYLYHGPSKIGLIHNDLYSHGNSGEI